MTPETTEQDDATPRSSVVLRWTVLALLTGVLVAGLVVSAIVVLANGAPGDKVSSVFDPPVDVTKDREQVLAAADTFATRFNTYGPDLLDQQGKMPKYAEVGTLMTAKFRKVFDENVVLAEKTVAETGIARVADVLGTGISALDEDSATVLIGTTVESSYPSPDDPKERISFAPQRFRYEIKLVKVDGAWLVDDLDDVDDGLPSLGTSSAQDAVPSGAPTPSTSPSSSPSSSPSPSGSPSEGSTTP